jgi:hypothetical protein
VNGSLDGIGTETRFFHPCGLALSPDNAHLFLVDSSNHLIRRIDVNNWETITLAGSAGAQGSTDGVGTMLPFPFLRMLLCHLTEIIFMWLIGTMTS